MTIKSPPDNIWDRILQLIGKKRRIVVPENVGEIYEKFGQHAIIKARKENFWKALFRKPKSDENTNTLNLLK
jgi:hypothetical protein